MSTYSTSHRVNGSGHLLNGRLGANVGVLYPGYRGSPVTAKQSRYDWFPPMTNDWGIMHPTLATAPLLLAEEDGPPT
jgi:hypothetical protein